MAASEIEPGENPVPQEASEPQAGPDLSAGAQRFQTCRWRKAAEGGVPDHCTHRDVLPLAGHAGFVPDSWCGDCDHFKVRRVPRKRPEPAPDDRFYYY